jgi:hypothetical protein
MNPVNKKKKKEEVFKKITCMLKYLYQTKKNKID